MMDIFIKMADCPEIQGRFTWEVGSLVIAKYLYGEHEYDGLCIVNSLHLKEMCPTSASDITARLYPFNAEYNRRDDCTYWKFTWLPTQAQLQAMVMFEYNRHGGEQITALELLRRFFKFAWNLLLGKSHSETFQWSMEQLWLAFVMWELHQKKWNGESWNKKEEDTK